MPGTSTVYDVKVKYTADTSAAGKGIEDLAKKTDKAKESTFSLKHALEALAIKEVFSLGAEHLIGFNQEMDNLKISMTTVMQMNMHMPFEKASAAADKLFETFQAMAKKSPLMTKDFMEMAANIAPAISMAGGGVGKLEKMTQGALTAGLAFNVRPDQMAMDIQEMLGGNVRLTSRTARQLLASQGMDHKEFNDKNSTERAQITEKILTDPAILKSAERMAHTLNGETSTFKDNLQIALGKVGKPLMESITKELKGWNLWLDKNANKLELIGHRIGDTLVTGFGFVKDAFKWIWDHGDILIKIAEAYAAIKIGGAIGGMVGGLKGLGGGLGKGVGGIGGALGKAGLLGEVFAGSYALASKFWELTGVTSKLHDQINPQQAALERVTKRLDDFDTAVANSRDALNSRFGANDARSTGRYANLQPFVSQQNAKAEALTELAELARNGDTSNIRVLNGRRSVWSKKLEDAGFTGTDARGFAAQGSSGNPHDASNLEYEAGQLRASARETMDKYNQGANYVNAMLALASTKSGQSLEQLKASEKTNLLLEEYLRGNYMNLDQILSALGFSKPDDKWGGNAAGKDININIARVEVASEDPDRFVFGLVNMAEQVLKHPTQSQHVTPGGF